MPPTKPHLRFQQPHRGFQRYQLWLLFILGGVGLGALANLDLPLSFKGYVLLLPVQLAALGYGLYWRRTPKS